MDSRLAQHWTFLLCDNEDDDDDDEQRATDSLSTPRTLSFFLFYFFLPPITLKDPDSLLWTVKPPPPHSSQPERQPRLARTYSRREPTDRRIYRTVREKSTREKHLVCLFICLSDRSTTLPQLHSQRLQWEITFLVNLIFFLSGLTFH